jgi:predicted DNA-binding transcriptional regulator AlpA
MTANQKRVLRAPEAATYTGLSESTLAKRRLYGLPPAFLNLGGRAIGYAIDDLDAWLASCRRRSTSQQSTNGEAA